MKRKKKTTNTKRNETKHPCNSYYNSFLCHFTVYNWRFFLCFRSVYATATTVLSFQVFAVCCVYLYSALRQFGIIYVSSDIESISFVLCISFEYCVWTMAAIGDGFFSGFFCFYLKSKSNAIIKCNYAKLCFGNVKWRKKSKENYQQIVHDWICQ